MVIDALKGMIVSLATLKTALTEVEIGAHLTVEAWALNRGLFAAIASGQGGTRDVHIN